MLQNGGGGVAFNIEGTLGWAMEDGLSDSLTLVRTTLAAAEKREIPFDLLPPATPGRQEIVWELASGSLSYWDSEGAEWCTEFRFRRPFDNLNVEVEWFGRADERRRRLEVVDPIVSIDAPDADSVDAAS